MTRGSPTSILLFDQDGDPVVLLRSPRSVTRSVLHGREHDGIITAEMNDEATRATYKNPTQRPLPGRRRADLHSRG